MGKNLNLNLGFILVVVSIKISFAGILNLFYFSKARLFKKEHSLYLSSVLRSPITMYILIVIISSDTFYMKILKWLVALRAESIYD